jgi:SAM-dependent methyltransferase
MTLHASIYRHRFDAEEQQRKERLWRVLCRHFLQRFVSPADTVLDLGAGYCEFINNIRCAKKYAVDLNEDTPRFASREVRVIQKPAWDLSDLGSGSVDTVFVSNFFEHLRSKEELAATLGEVERVLRPGGRLMVLQPNIRYAYREYWDFLDHHVPLSHLSLAEALEIGGLRVVEVRPRFLPYTTKSRLPRPPALLRLYLVLRPLHRLLGKQMFIVAEKPQTATSGRPQPPSSGLGRPDAGA